MIHRHVFLLLFVLTSSTSLQEHFQTHIQWGQFKANRCITFYWRIQFNNCLLLSSFTYNIHYGNHHHGKYEKYSRIQYLCGAPRYLVNWVKQLEDSKQLSPERCLQPVAIQLVLKFVFHLMCTTILKTTACTVSRWLLKSLNC